MKRGGRDISKGSFLAIYIYIYVYIYGNCANQSCMALALVRCSIEADQGGTPHARARVSLVSWEGRSHALLFMVPLGLPSARPMAQALRLPFEYYIYNYIYIHIYSYIL